MEKAQEPWHYRQEQPENETSNIIVSHKLQSKWVSEAERASEASSAEQANEWAVLANERA